MLSGLTSRPIRTVLRWQLLATVLSATLFWWFAGVHGAASAALGGLVTVAAGIVFALIGAPSPDRPAASALAWLLRAEAAKIGSTVLLLWLVLALYDDVVVTALIVTFVISTLIFSMAAFVREH
jgi:ATP synthase protein I